MMSDIYGYQRKSKPTERKITNTKNCMAAGKVDSKE